MDLRVENDMMLTLQTKSSKLVNKPNTKVIQFKSKKQEDLFNKFI